MFTPADRPAVELVDFGLGPYVHGTPSRRFPVYTRGNSGEVYPQVVFPFSASLSAALGGDPARDAMLATGVMTAAECDEDADVHMGVFGGYTYLNLSVTRVVAIRTPGATLAETDATYLGAEGVAPPHEPRRDDRNLRATLRGVRYGFSILGGRGLDQVDGDRAEVDAWLAALPDFGTATDDELVALVEQAFPMLGRLFGNHLLVTGGAGIGLALLRRACEQRLGDGDLALRLLAGIGDVASATPSFDLWDLGRQVAASPEVTACFDAGLDGLEDRLRAEPSAAGFLDAFEAFLGRHGARGPNEWEVACEVWGTDHALPLALVDRMRVADPGQSPVERSARLAGEREALLAEARSRLGRLHRRWFERCLRCAESYSRAREADKTLLVELIHGCRLALRELGRRLADRSGGARDDLWYVLYEELDDYRRDREHRAGGRPGRRRRGAHGDPRGAGGGAGQGPGGHRPGAARRTRAGRRPRGSDHRPQLDAVVRSRRGGRRGRWRADEPRRDRGARTRPAVCGQRDRGDDVDPRRRARRGRRGGRDREGPGRTLRSAGTVLRRWRRGSRP